MTLTLGILFSIIALLYAAVGLGGGSGYLAVMGLMGVAPEIMRPTALTLNILVAGISTFKHARAGQFSARLFWPIALMSIPFAFLGGRLILPANIYRPIVGLVLLYAAVRLWLNTRQTNVAHDSKTRLPIWVPVVSGAIIGLISGLVGLGGGIFLGPLLLLTQWADTRQTMGITAAFVLVNSIAGLVGNISVVESLPAQLPYWLLAVGVGGWLGAEISIRRLGAVRLRQILALILVIAALRMIFAP